MPRRRGRTGADRSLEEIAQRLRTDGRRPYIIHLSLGHPPLGALGYVVAAQEILAQIAESSFTIDEIIVASGSGATHACLLFGLRSSGSIIPVKGICVRRSKDLQYQRIVMHCAAIAKLLKITNPVCNDDLELSDDNLAPGYGKINDAVLEAVKLSAHQEGLILNPVYTGRAMAGFIQLARQTNQEKPCRLFTLALL